MTRFLSALAVALALFLIHQTFFPGLASAHERRNVSKYEFVVGFIVEPALEGQKNGTDLRVTDTETKKPVEGLEKTLQVEITHVTTGVSRTFQIRGLFRDAGHYTNDLIPTAPGKYSFRFFGNIEGMPVNETFLSGTGRFSDAESSSDLQFPDKLPDLREVNSAVRGVQNTAQQAQDKASSASILAIVGIVLGAIGIASAAGSALVAVRRK